MFVCCAVLRPGQHSFHVESVSEPTHTVHGQISLAVNLYLVHVFLPIQCVIRKTGPREPGSRSGMEHIVYLQCRGTARFCFKPS